MNILKSISATFSRFWRWIRETAWVQPLLIVGAIFAIIFSIPKFTTWFNAMGADSSSSYFTSYRLSLEGEGRVVEGTDGKETTYNSEADKLTRTLATWSSMFVNKTKYASYEEYYAAVKASGAIDAYGEKYFLAYVSRDSSGSDAAQGGFETLEDYWGSRFSEHGANETFCLHTIFTDDTSTNDDDYTVENDKKAFSRYLNKWNGGDGGADFFSYVGTAMEETPYKTNASIAESNYEHITMPDVDTWSVPTIFLVDYTEAAYNSGTYGVCEALFSVTGDDDYEKATLLLQMWNHTDGKTDNPFSDAYLSTK